jgi:hypothetical protein
MNLVAQHGYYKRLTLIELYDRESKVWLLTMLVLHIV